MKALRCGDRVAMGTTHLTPVFRSGGSKLNTGRTQGRTNADRRPRLTGPGGGGRTRSARGPRSPPACRGRETGVEPTPTRPHALLPRALRRGRRATASRGGFHRDHGDHGSCPPWAPCHQTASAQTLNRWSGRAATIVSKTTSQTKTAVKRLASKPKLSVPAKPLMGPVPN